MCTRTDNGILFSRMIYSGRISIYGRAYTCTFICEMYLYIIINYTDCGSPGPKNTAAAAAVLRFH